MWLVVIILARVDIAHFHHRRKFLDNTGLDNEVREGKIVHREIFITADGFTLLSTL